MRWLSDVVYRIRAIFSRARLQRELDDEVAFHLEMEARKLEAAGTSPEEARRLAAVAFGGADRFKEQARASWGVAPLADLGGDLRFALRQLRRRPAFTALAALTLGLGIGGTIALFSVVSGLLVRPLPFTEGERLVTFWSPYNWRGVEFDFVRERVTAFEDVAAFSNDGVTLRTPDGSTLHLATVASANLFEVLGARPLLGSAFRPGDDRPGAEPVIVLSHALWRQQFGSDPSIVGRRVEANGRPTTVLGVMPPDFFFPAPEMDAWIPLELDPASGHYQNNGWLVLVGRVRPGLGEQEVQADIGGLAAALGERWDYPDAWDKTRSPSTTPLRTYLVGDVRPVLLLLLGAAAAVLLMASVNVAGLVLTRSSDRLGEMAVRVALGAGRARLARQILVESVVLGLIAGAVGVALALALFDVLVAFLPLTMDMGSTLSLDWPMLLGGLALAAAAGASVALAPMRSLLRGDPGRAFQGSRRQSGTGSGSGRLQASLVAVEVLLTMVLATGAALLVRTVDQLRAVDVGLDPDGVVALDVFLPPQAIAGEERGLYFDALVERAAALPGVRAAGLTNRLPVRDGGWQGTVRAEDRPDLVGDRSPNSFWRAVTPGTFEALGVRLAEGRGIEPSDVDGALPVVVVNQAFARTMWGEESAIGRRVSRGAAGGDGWLEVVGVVHDVAVDDLVGAVPMAMYLPWAQAMRTSEYGILTLDAGADPAGALQAVRRLVGEIDPRATVGRAETMEAVLEQAMATPLRLRFFLGTFSLLGIVLGAVGIYGVVSYGVGRRRGEFGVRLALGARPRQLLGEVVGGGMVPVLVGVGLGIVAALLASATLDRFLYEVAPTDPVSVAGAATVLLLTGALAALVPAWRASMTHPSTCLRSD